MGLQIPISFEQLETKIERALQRGAVKGTKLGDLFLVVYSPVEGEINFKLPEKLFDELNRSFTHKRSVDPSNDLLRNLKIPNKGKIRVFFKKDVPCPPGAFLLNLKYGFKYPNVSVPKQPKSALN